MLPSHGSDSAAHHREECCFAWKAVIAREILRRRCRRRVWTSFRGSGILDSKVCREAWSAYPVDQRSSNGFPGFTGRTPPFRSLRRALRTGFLVRLGVRRRTYARRRTCPRRQPDGEHPLERSRRLDNQSPSLPDSRPGPQRSCQSGGAAAESGAVFTGARRGGRDPGLQRRRAGPAQTLTTIERPSAYGVAIARQLALYGRSPLFLQVSPSLRHGADRRLACTLEAAQRALVVSSDFDSLSFTNINQTERNPRWQ